MFFFVLCHEIEHSYQYLMAYDVVDAPCDLVRDSYKLIIDCLICRNYEIQNTGDTAPKGDIASIIHVMWWLVKCNLQYIVG